MSRGRHKEEKRRRKRKLAQKKARASAARRAGPSVKLLAAAPFGPCAVSAGWNSEEDLPHLVTVVVTRKLYGDRLFPVLALLDRTCLGVKDAHMPGPMTEGELWSFLHLVGEPYGGMEECPPLVAQSLVFHAVDYARRLGFEPHRDFVESLYGPRPAQLLPTPWHAEERPIYLSGPRDDAQRVLSRLDAAVGAGNYDFITTVAASGEGDPESARLVEGFQLSEEISSLLARCARGEGVVIGLGGFVLFSTTTGDAWLIEAFSNGALNLMRDYQPADYRIAEDDQRVEVEWRGSYQLRGADFVTDALPGAPRVVRGYPTEAICATIERLRAGYQAGG
jgi:hypothetical protein